MFSRCRSTFGSAYPFIAAGFMILIYFGFIEASILMGVFA